MNKSNANPHQHSPRFAAASVFLCVFVLLVGCKPVQPAVDARSVASAAANRQAPQDFSSDTTPDSTVASDTSQGQRAMSPLQILLQVFCSDAQPAWAAFDHVAGITWRDTAPQDNPDANSPDTARYRSGNLLLAGFGMVDVPDGNVGADAGTKQDNEGNVGVTLNGSDASVDSITLQKFYPSDDTQVIIQRQLGGSTKVVPVAGSCEFDDGTTAANTQKNAFFHIDGASPAPLYAETYVDEDDGAQGPGDTVFVFYRSKPTQRIAAMRCKEA